MADEQDQTAPSAALFHGVRFAIVRSHDLADDAAQEVTLPLFSRRWPAWLTFKQVRNSLEKNGATCLAFDAESQLPHGVTHIISTTEIGRAHV